MIGLILVDVDGTLFGKDGVPECAWAAVEKARLAGVHFGICTGRPGRGKTLDYAKKLDPNGFHIFESGSVIVDGEGTIQHSEPLDKTTIEKMIHIADQHDLGLEIYSAEGGFFVEKITEDIAAHEKMLGLEAERIEAQQYHGTICRVQFVVRPSEKWDIARSEIHALGLVELHEATSPGLPGVIFASATMFHVSKKSAAKWVSARLGMTLQQTAMIGDGENDLEVIKAAGLGIAMGNSPLLVQEAADFVVAHVDECGLAEAIEYVLSVNLNSQTA